MNPFARSCLSFAGQTGWVVGRGPTAYRYEDLARVDGPVFFINDAVAEERWLPAGHPAFFFAHDRQMAVWLQRPELRATPVLLTDVPVTGPEGDRRPGLLSGPEDPLLRPLPHAVLYRGTGPLFPPMLLNRTREDLRALGQLYLASGTIHPLIHFAWYVGCARLKFIGCDGLPGIGYDPRLENRSQTQQKNALFIRRAQELLLRRLKLPAEYLGTPHRRIMMIYELRAPAGGGEDLRAWADRLGRQFTAAGCPDVKVKDGLEAGESLWLTGTWPSLESCVTALAAPEHLEVQAAGEALQARTKSIIRFAYQTKPESAPPPE